MANKRIIELQERTQLDVNDYLIVDSSTSTRKLSMSTLLNYMTMTQMIFVTELPTEDISTSTIYLVPHSGSNTQWDEYIYRENAWVLIGTSTIDLSAIYQTNDKAAIQNNDIPWYGTSSTAAATTAKIATTTDSNFALVTGAKVSIKFTYTNTASAPTLNVDGKGAKSIKAYGTTAPSVWWKAGDVVEFTYDGTNWIMGATSGEIEQLNSDLNRGYVEVTTDGVKTIAQILNALFALIDFSKVRNETKLLTISSIPEGIFTGVYHNNGWTPNAFARFSNGGLGTTTDITMQNANSQMVRTSIGGGGVTSYEDRSSIVLDAGTAYRIVY